MINDIILTVRKLELIFCENYTFNLIYPTLKQYKRTQFLTVTEVYGYHYINIYFFLYVLFNIMIVIWHTYDFDVTG